MSIDRLRKDDIDPFLALAAAEGWICDRWEFDFLLRAFPQGCFVFREDGLPAGFVTSVKYDRSGWIGNLIVREGLRGRGIGAALMKKALAALAEAGTETVWLTASQDGKPMYERLGFAEMDTVFRWSGSGSGGDAPEEKTVDYEDVMILDRAGWGDVRDLLIRAVGERGRLLGGRDGFLFRQACGEAVQLGPWGGIHAEGAAKLLDEGLAETRPGARVFLDVPGKNLTAAALLLARGFRVKGSTSLMCRGKAPIYRPEWIYALASMGSMG